MSACNGGIPSEAIETFFNTIQCPFPDLENDKIDTVQFLEAARGVVDLIDRFGKVFSPVKYDMNGNIEKLSRKYNEDPETYKYLQTMILNEKDQGLDTATDALMWLRRALQFVHRFFDCIIQDGRNDLRTEDLAVFLKVSYMETLQRYHGWMAQQLFNLLSRMCPNRAQLFLTMSLGKDHRDDYVLRDITVFNDRLNTCIQELVVFYAANGLENHQRV